MPFHVRHTKLIKSNAELDDQVVLIGWLEVHATLCFNFVYILPDGRFNSMLPAQSLAAALFERWCQAVAALLDWCSLRGGTLNGQFDFCSTRTRKRWDRIC